MFFFCHTINKYFCIFGLPEDPKSMQQGRKIDPSAGCRKWDLEDMRSTIPKLRMRRLKDQLTGCVEIACLRWSPSGHWTGTTEVQQNRVS